MSGFDGPALRSLREGRNVSLRRVARLGGLTHGHLSKVERGELGRPVSPAVLRAYESAIGFSLRDVAGHSTPTSRQPGQLSEAMRRNFNARVAGIAIGGHLAERIETVLDNTGRLTVPESVDESDVRQIEQLAQVCTEIDLTYGGAVSGQVTRALLRWAIGLLSAEAKEPTRHALYAAIAALAHRAGWSAFDAHRHEVSRNLFTIALCAAGRADDPDLRAHILADLAAGHSYLGHPHACLQLVRLAEVDERVSASVQLVLAGVKARAHALSGDADACRQSIQLADHAHTDAAAAECGGWRRTVATAGRLNAITGHAWATLARRTRDDQARTHAVQRLSQAYDQMDSATQRRSVALVTAQLATLYAEAGDQQQGGIWAARGEQLAAGVRSARLTSHLNVMRTALTDADKPAPDLQPAYDQPAHSTAEEGVSGVQAV